MGEAPALMSIQKFTDTADDLRCTDNPHDYRCEQCTAVDTLVAHYAAAKSGLTRAQSNEVGLMRLISAIIHQFGLKGMLVSSHKLLEAPQTVETYYDSVNHGVRINLVAGDE